MDEVHHLLHVSLSQVAGGEGGCAQSQTAGFQRRLVTWAGVLVDGDADLFQDFLPTSAIQLLWPEVHQHQVIVRATWVGKERPEFPVNVWLVCVWCVVCGVCVCVCCVQVCARMHTHAYLNQQLHVCILVWQHSAF